MATEPTIEVDQREPSWTELMVTSGFLLGMSYREELGDEHRRRLRIASEFMQKTLVDGVYVLQGAPSSSTPPVPKRPSPRSLSPDPSLP